MFSFREASRLLDSSRFHAVAWASARARQRPGACGSRSSFLEDATLLLAGAAHAKR